MEVGPEAWLTRLNNVLHAHGMNATEYVTMEMFNASLAQVKKLHQDYYNTLNKPEDRRFYVSQACDPPDVWQQGCFCPLAPNLAKDGVNMIKTEHANSVAWAYHLAAMLRLMPEASHRQRYMEQGHLIDARSDTTLFLGGVTPGLTKDAFQIFLQSLEPPVWLHEAQEFALGGRDGRVQVACYKLELQKGNPFAARRALVQMTLAFHQRVVDWPGEHSHTKCIPWVMGKTCNLSMIHHPVLIIELALAAWGMKVEKVLPSLEDQVLACKLGLLGKHGLNLFTKRQTAAVALKAALPERFHSLLSEWVERCRPAVETDLWGNPLSTPTAAEEESQVPEVPNMGTAYHGRQTLPEQCWSGQSWAGKGQWSNVPSGKGWQQWNDQTWQPAPGIGTAWHAQSWAGKGYGQNVSSGQGWQQAPGMGTAYHGTQAGPEQQWDGEGHGPNVPTGQARRLVSDRGTAYQGMQEWPDWGRLTEEHADDGNRAAQDQQVDWAAEAEGHEDLEEPEQEAEVNRVAAAPSGPAQQALHLLETIRAAFPGLTTAQLAAELHALQARQKLREPHDPA